MNSALKLLQTNGLEKIAAGASSNVIGAIHKASADTGVDFAYLVQQAKVESSFDPSAKAKTSSATGLYQFIDSTWMDMINKHGAKYGVNTNQSREALLKLRRDPEIASAMAAEFAAENQRFLEKNWGGEIGATELYLAHFMGAGGATSFMNARDEDPTQQAALLFPKAASANRTVFYDTKTGRPKTMDEVYAFFDNKFEIDISPLPQVQPESAPQKSIIFNRRNNHHDLLARTSPSPRSSYQLLAQYETVFNPVHIMIMAQLDLPMK